MKLIKWGAIVIVLLGIGGALGSSESSDSEPVRNAEQREDVRGDAVPSPDDPDLDAAAASAAEEEEPAPRVREPARPDGRFSGNCDYVLGDFEEYTEAGYRFVAGGKLRNTGNVGIVARVTAKWEQLGSTPVRDVQEVRIDRGRKQRYSAKVLVGNNEIDLHQSADGDCDVNVKIVDTYGKPPWE